MFRIVCIICVVMSVALRELPLFLFGGKFLSNKVGLSAL